MKIKLPASHAAALTFQSYGPQPEIQDVTYTPLKKHPSLEGSFMEYLRLTDGRVEGIPADFQCRQISFSQAAPHRINAFHIHPRETQDELWCVIQGALKVCLVDLREGSPTVHHQRHYILTGEAPALLYIPTGVAHGYRAGSEGAVLVYAMNSQFNIEAPNEGRLPYDHFGTEVWEDDRG